MTGRSYKRRHRTWALTLMLALVVSGMTAAKTLAAHTHASGGVLTQGFKNDLATLDPAIGYDYNNWPAEKMVFDGLLDYNDGTSIEPRLASRMPAISNGGKTYTFQLRHGVKFSN